ncbi:hypothetical protein TNIN_77461 [Trichonephila inaurata madagascariensis]|uniref:Uncharacterized protein n=1 Tax=Trichonephila inaurata madagascariensis TaxID=2747483 RepID=A0A8X6WVN9_9ARAC|nr:hypothetical protein TNIN_77461 [Trichonephila inaurata madagascariensis]
MVLHNGAVKFCIVYARYYDHGFQIIPMKITFQHNTTSSELNCRRSIFPQKVSPGKCQTQILPFDRGILIRCSREPIFIVLQSIVTKLAESRCCTRRSEARL